MRKFYLVLITCALFLVFYLGILRAFKYQNEICESPIHGKLELKLQEDLIIKESETDENYIFYRVSDIGVDSEGNIYIVDSGNCRVQKFDENGRQEI